MADSGPGRVLVIACGAIARELVRIRNANNWAHIEFQCLPAELHNRPEKIPGEVRRKIEQEGAGFDRVFVAYADCGTGGLLDKVLEETGTERIPGAHCYEFYTGSEDFGRLAAEEPGTFFLTDFLAQHFDRLVIRGLGLDRRPELLPLYFGNYRRVLYLAQTHDAELQARARKAAESLGLEYACRYTGDEPLKLALKPALN